MADISFIVNPPRERLNPNHLAQLLRQISGVSAVHIDPADSRAFVSYNPEKVDTFMLVSAVQDAGYTVPAEPIRLIIADMTCAGCVFHIESALTDVSGVIDVEIDLQSGKTIVNVVSGYVELNTLYNAVRDTGYRVMEPVSGS